VGGWKAGLGGTPLTSSCTQPPRRRAVARLQTSRYWRQARRTCRRTLEGSGSISFYVDPELMTPMYLEPRIDATVAYRVDGNWITSIVMPVGVIDGAQCHAHANLHLARNGQPALGSHGELAGALLDVPTSSASPPSADASEAASPVSLPP
jgi:hypothetical protein